MRTVITTLVAASFLIAAPAFAAGAKWKVGERVPGAYSSSSRFKADTAALSLPKAPPVHRWIHVEASALLVNNQNDVIVQIVNVAAKG